MKQTPGPSLRIGRRRKRAGRRSIPVESGALGGRLRDRSGPVNAIFTPAANSLAPAPAPAPRPWLAMTMCGPEINPVADPGAGPESSLRSNEGRRSLAPRPMQARGSRTNGPMGIRPAWAKNYPPIAWRQKIRQIWPWTTSHRGHIQPFVALPGSAAIGQERSLHVIEQ